MKFSDDFTVDGVEFQVSGNMIIGVKAISHLDQDDPDEVEIDSICIGGEEIFPFIDSNNLIDKFQTAVLEQLK